MNIALFGIQGSGKGTQARMLSERLGYEIFETGAELRRLAKEDSDLGRTIHQTINVEGNLVTIDIIERILRNFLETAMDKNKIVFDWIPRNAEQKTLFDKLMDEYGIKVLPVLVEITESLAYDRVATRRICADCGYAPLSNYEGDICPKCNGELIRRADDADGAALQKRMSIFYEHTQPVIDEYERKGNLLRIQGDQEVETIYDEIVSHISDNNT